MSTLSQAISNSEKVGMSQNWFTCAECKEQCPGSQEQKEVVKEAGDQRQWCKSCQPDEQLVEDGDVVDYYERYKHERIRELRKDMRYD